MKRCIILLAILLAFGNPITIEAYNFYWKASKAQLDAVSGLAEGDRGLVITDTGDVTFYTRESSAWVEASGSSGGEINVKAYGAAGDGITDDSDAFIAAFAAGERIYIEEGSYLLSKSIPISANQKVRGDGIDKTILLQSDITSASQGTFYADSESSSTQLSNIHISDLTLNGQSDTLGFSEHKHLISLNGVNNAIVERVKFLASRGDGIYLGSGDTAGQERHNTNVTIRNCVFDGNGKENRNGISVIDGSFIMISGNYFTDYSKSTMPGPICVEPDANAFHLVSNIHILDNEFVDCGGATANVVLVLSNADYTVKPHDFHIVRNIFRQTGTAAGAAVYLLDYDTPSATTIASNVFIQSNYISKMARPFYLLKGKRIVVENNTILDCTSSVLVGYSTAGQLTRDVRFSGNQWYSSGDGTQCIAVFKSDYLTFMNETFIDTSFLTITFVAAGTSSYVTITGLAAQNSGSAILYPYYIYPTHTMTKPLELQTSFTDFVDEGLTGTSGQMVRAVAEATANIEADASTTITLSIPAGAKLIGCQLRVDTALATGELWDAAYSGGSTQAIASGKGDAKNTKAVAMFDSNAATDITSTTTNIAITKNGGGSFTAEGTIRAIVYYWNFIAMSNL